MGKAYYEEFRIVNENLRRYPVPFIPPIWGNLVRGGCREDLLQNFRLNQIRELRGSKPYSGILEQHLSVLHLGLIFHAAIDIQHILRPGWFLHISSTKLTLLIRDEECHGRIGVVRGHRILTRTVEICGGTGIIILAAPPSV